MPSDDLTALGGPEDVERRSKAGWWAMAASLHVENEALQARLAAVRALADTGLKKARARRETLMPGHVGFARECALVEAYDLVLAVLNGAEPAAATEVSAGPAEAPAEDASDERTEIRAFMAPILSEALGEIAALVGLPADTSEVGAVVDAVRRLAGPAEAAEPTREPIADLIERSSLGTPEAKAARARVSDEKVAQIMARVKQLDEERADSDTPREDDTPAPAPALYVHDSNCCPDCFNGLVTHTEPFEDCPCSSAGSVTTTPTQPTWPGTHDEDDSLVARLDRALSLTGPHDRPSVGDLTIAQGHIRRVRQAIDEGGIRCRRGHYTAHDDVIGDPNSPRWKCSHCVRVGVDAQTIVDGMTGVSSTPDPAAAAVDEPYHLELYGISGTTDAIADSLPGEAQWLVNRAGQHLREAADLLQAWAERGAWTDPRAALAGNTETDTEEA